MAYHIGFLQTWSIPAGHASVPLRSVGTASSWFQALPSLTTLCFPSPETFLLSTGSNVQGCVTHRWTGWGLIYSHLAPACPYLQSFFLIRCVISNSIHFPFHMSLLHPHLPFSKKFSYFQVQQGIYSSSHLAARRWQKCPRLKYDWSPKDPSGSFLLGSPFGNAKVKNWDVGCPLLLSRIKICFLFGKTTGKQRANPLQSSLGLHRGKANTIRVTVSMGCSCPPAPGVQCWGLTLSWVFLLKWNGPVFEDDHANSCQLPVKPSNRKILFCNGEVGVENRECQGFSNQAEELPEYYQEVKGIQKKACSTRKELP